MDVDNTGDSCYVGNIILLLMVGLLVNGPYALITTAVSAELGTHPSLRGSGKALATVTSIIDGTGSIGAAVGPFLAGALQVFTIFRFLDYLIVFSNYLVEIQICSTMKFCREAEVALHLGRFLVSTRCFIC